METHQFGETLQSLLKCSVSCFCRCPQIRASIHLIVGAFWISVLAFLANQNCLNRMHDGFYFGSSGNVSEKWWEYNKSTKWCNTFLPGFVSRIPNRLQEGITSFPTLLNLIKSTKVPAFLGQKIFFSYSIEIWLTGHKILHLRWNSSR